MTEDWEKRLRKRAAAVKRAENALKQDIAAARLEGLSFRKLGELADVNHETARTTCAEVNGHTKTRAELGAETRAPGGAEGELLDAVAPFLNSATTGIAEAVLRTLYQLTATVARNQVNDLAGARRAARSIDLARVRFPDTPAGARLRAALEGYQQTPDA